MPREQHIINNRLLLALPEAVLERLRPSLRYVELVQGEPIDHANGTIAYIYFVNRGFISMVKTMRDGRSVEVGGVGIEGMTTPGSLMGMDTAVLDTVVQVPGSAFRIEREALLRELPHSPRLDPADRELCPLPAGPGRPDGGLQPPPFHRGEMLPLASGGA